MNIPASSSGTNTWSHTNNNTYFCHLILLYCVISMHSKCDSLLTLSFVPPNHPKNAPCASRRFVYPRDDEDHVSGLMVMALMKVMMHH